MKTAYHFFLKHAGYSYDLITETKAQGQRRCAKALVNAEKISCASGWSFEWAIDQYSTSEDLNDEIEAYELWQCVMRDIDGNVLASLHGIDFGPGADPWGDPYRRVVQAELALEAIANR